MRVSGLKKLHLQIEHYYLLPCKIRFKNENYLSKTNASLLTYNIA